MRHRGEYTGFRVALAEEWFEPIKKLLNKEEQEEMGDEYRWRSTRGKVRVDISILSNESLQKTLGWLKAKADAGDKMSRIAENLFRQWIEIKDSPDGVAVTKLENVPAAMKAYLEGAAPNRWVFEVEEDGNTLPWFVNSVTYTPPGEYSQAHVSVALTAMNASDGESKRENGSGCQKNKSVSITPGNFRRSVVSEILRNLDIYVETPARLESYKVELEKYNELASRDGFQMSVSGKNNLMGGWYAHGFRGVEKSGRPAKMVMDPPEMERGSTAMNSPFWDESEDKIWQVPVHPIWTMFDLTEHENYRVHVNNAVPYVYDLTVGDKLILPKAIKDFIEVLVEHSKNAFTDIVSGKEGGTIILFEGPPGTGKTLSAEVYSEVMQRPLYKVQSSQLGTDPATVEKQLGEVLERSERWGAILLIDEADVYVHERGDNIKQNAIVGVFLRVLEYYRGVLFMTTNRGTLVDDAIISRLTARFKYNDPDEPSRRELWNILSKQNGVDISDGDINALAKELPWTSGRDIKNLLKMAYVVALKKGEKRVTAELVKFVSQFQAKT